MKKKTTKPRSRTQKNRRGVKAAAVDPKPETVLVLRTTDANGRSYGDFQWPETGPVECLDWKPTNACGNGLHGWLWGAGDWSLKSQAEAIKWKVVEVLKSDIIDLKGKVKFPRGTVLATFGHWRDAMALIRARLAETVVENRATTTRPGEYASATGNSGHASATGYYGHASATGDSGHASATGNSGHASATGDYGHASATGYYGHASATGYYGWAIAGHGGRARADKNGALTVLWWDEKSKRYRVTVGYVGEDGIKAGVWYVANTKGELVPA